MPRTRKQIQKRQQRDRKRLFKLSLGDQKDRARLFVKFVLLVEEKLPGATGAEKKAWVKRSLDTLIALPPIAEEISDLIIEIGTEIAYAAVKNAKLSDSMVVIEKDRLKYLTECEAYVEANRT
jgi:hypothetical protein